jgi:heat shock protein HslJ
MTRGFPAALLALVAATPVMAQDITLPLTARGNEPVWSVEASPDGLRLSAPKGKGTAQTLPFTQTTDGGSLILMTTDFTLRIDPTLCRDVLSGMPYPYSATLTHASTDLDGCAGDPDALLAGDWTATTLNGTPVPQGALVTLAFDTGNVIGKAACNRFTGSYEWTGEGLSFGAIGATRMACPSALMETEQAVFSALSVVTRFDIAEDGSLLLQSDDRSTVLTARR